MIRKDAHGHPGRDSGFVGRRRELEALCRGLETARSGRRGRVFVVEGEPGIGKSTVAAEFAALARDSGAKVFWGQGEHSADSPPVLWPWIQILQDRLCDDDRQEARQSDAELPDLASERGRFEVLADRASTVSAEIIARLILDLLSEPMRLAPAVVVLDDLDRADLFSFEVLGLVARETCQAPLLIIASCHEFALRSSPAPARAFANIASMAEWLRLSGFDEQELAELVEARMEAKVDPAFLRSLHQVTGGNPLLAQLLLRQRLNVFEPVRRMPDALRAAIECHLVPLSKRVRNFLAAAALIGAQFDVEVLRAVVGAQGLEDAFTDSEAAGLIIQSDDVPGRYRFVHAVIRDALCEELPYLERANLHAQVGEALIDLRRFEPEVFAEIAFHLSESGCRHGRIGAKVIEYCKRAAEYAESFGRFAEASRFYALALSALALRPGRRESARCDLLLALGKVQLKEGHPSEASETFERAAILAERIGDAKRLARVALALAGDSWTAAIGSFRAPQVRLLLEKSLQALEGSDNPLMALLSVRLAAELSGQPQTEERRAKLLEEATLITNRSNDSEALIRISKYRHLFLLADPRQTDDRLTNAQKLMDVSAAAGSDEYWCRGFMFRYVDMLRRGDVTRADKEAVALAQAVQLTGKHLFRTCMNGYTATRSLIEGRFEEVAHYAWQFFADAEAAYPEGVTFFLTGAVTPFRELDRLNEILDIADRSAQNQPWLLVLRAVLAQVHLGLGDTEGARSLFNVLTANRLSDLVYKVSAGAYLAVLSELCAELDEHDCTSALYERLLRYAGFNIMLGPMGFLGPAARYLGVLAAMLGRYEEAESHLIDAIRLSAKTGARPWTAYCQHDLARILLERSNPDSERINGLLLSASATAEALGMKWLSRRIALLREKSQTAASRAVSRLPLESGNTVAATGPSADCDDHGEARGRASEPGAASPKSAAILTGDEEWSFVREGEYWSIRFQGRVTRLKHSKGLALIAHLLRHPGHEIHVSDLDMNVAVDPDLITDISPLVDDPRGVTTHAADAGPQLDAPAKAAYRRRLNELRKDLEEATSFNDLGRIARDQEEIDFICQELARAVGLNGRDRKAASEVERARLRVTNAIRASLEKIAKVDAALKRHLAATIRTGNVCCYLTDDDKSHPWRL